jgi:ribonuclease HI
VPAHQVGGDPLNDFADRAASMVAIAQEAAGSAYGSADPPPSATGEGSAAASRVKRPAAAARKSAGGTARTLKAKFPGRCRCGRSYTAGEEIAKNDDGWGHPACRVAAV